MKHSSVGKSLRWHFITIIVFNAKVIFQVYFFHRAMLYSNTIIHISYFTFFHLDSYLILKYTSLFSFCYS